jgi:hypothetical protein
MRSPAWLDNWPAGLTIEIKYLPCPLEPPAAVAFPRLRQPSPFPGLFNGYVVRRVVRPACCIIRGLTRIPAHIPARSVLKRLSLAITTVANTRNLLQGFILTSLQGARVAPSALWSGEQTTELRLRRTVLRLRRKVLLEQWMQICRSCLEQGLLLLPLVNRNLFYLRLLGA